MKINYISLCSGYGAECIALKRLRRDNTDFDFECLAWSEIEPNAIKAHDALHPEYVERNLGDMTKVDWESWHERIGNPHIGLLFASTPCQTVSQAGKREGMKKGSATESALIWATEDCIRTLHPDMIIFENVRGMVSPKNKPDFDAWLKMIEGYGYKCHWQILDALDYGTPQHRERVFIVCNKKSTRPTFPRKIKLTKRLSDVLLKDYPEWSLVSDERKRNALKTLKPNAFEDRETPLCVASTDGSSWGAIPKSQYRCYSPTGVSPTLSCCQGGSREPKVIILCKKLKIIGYTRDTKGKVSSGHIHEHSNTMHCTGGSTEQFVAHLTEDDIIVRRFVPQEMARLMGLSDDEYFAIESTGMSNSAMKKLFGNSIEANTTYHLFRTLLLPGQPENNIQANTQLNLFDNMD